MLANSPTSVVQDVILNDRSGSIKIDDTIGNIIERQHPGCTCCLHLLTNQGQIGFEIELWTKVKQSV